MVSQEELLDRFDNIRVWKRGDQRAPHKPLLILFMLGRVQRREPRMVSYAEVADVLQLLLDDFGPPRRTTPAYPFYHLSNDGIWEFTAPGVLNIAGSPSNRFLLDNNVSGGFSKEINTTLINNPALIKIIAWKLLKQNFPCSLYVDILRAAGLDIGSGFDVGMTDHRNKVLADPYTHDSNFRERILVAYSYKCAVCSFNVWLGRVPVALEAAHIKWHQAGGPDQENNGLLLCAMHRKLFDLGAFSIDQNYTIRVSEKAHGGEGFDQWLVRYQGQPIRIPEQPLYQPKGQYIDWHIREVFHGPARYLGG
jgi:putative restriction endonuclease